MFILTPQCLGHFCSSLGERYQFHPAFRRGQVMVCQARPMESGLQFHPCQLLHCGCHSHAVTYQYSPGFTSSLVSATKQRDSVHTAGLFFFLSFLQSPNEMKCNRRSKFEFLYFVCPKDREWGKETERHSCPAWQPLWKKAGPERETVRNLPPSSWVTISWQRSFSACPVVLKIE